MTTTKSVTEVSIPSEVEPLCPVYAECGGCDFQHLTYERELSVKSEFLKGRFVESLEIDAQLVSEVVPSPEPYHYRNRLDLTMRRRRDVGPVLGFQSAGSKKLIAVDECAIAEPSISKFIPQLREEAKLKFTEKYRTANLVIKTGAETRVRWGGIGRRSLQLKPEDYFWAEIDGKRIYYSLDTFFQANTSILSSLMRHIEDLAGFDSETIFYDLYAGVGLFGIYFADKVKHVVMIEEVDSSCQVMAHNLKYHQIKNAENIKSRVEDVLTEALKKATEKKKIAMIDPPRRGLSTDVLNTLVHAKELEKLFYLSCHPESLLRDLQGFKAEGWNIQNIIPFDFFPKTRHLETLVMLVPS